MKLYHFCKRIMDILVSTVVLIVLLPFLLILVIVIKLDNTGPAVFRQERAGKDGKPFMLFKFRTMKQDVDPFRPSPKTAYDPRLTRVGIFLRERSLDELPQLINVFLGSMSLVGPRPLYVSQISEWDNRQKKRLEVKPGLTGLAQVSGRGELTREEKLELDVEYVEKKNFWFDIKIICVTFREVFGQKSIYEKKYSKDEYTRGDNL